MNSFRAANLADKVKVRDTLYDYPSLIDQYCDKNPDGDSQSAVAIIRSWKRFVRSTFTVERA